MNIVFIGAGKLATSLALALYQQSHQILQVYSRTLESATKLASKIQSKATNDLSKIMNADLYIFSVKDSALSDILAKIPSNNGFWIHTAGSLSIDIFKEYTSRYGVLYPLQTFSENRTVTFSEVPIFVEANTPDNENILIEISKGISNKVYKLSSKKRKYLHLTGVFACNFVNQMYAISEDILKQQDIPFEVLLPLIDETAAKVHSLAPKDAQTGPAIRFDENIINKHISLIENPKLKEIYQLISEYIHETNNTK